MKRVKKMIRSSANALGYDIVKLLPNHMELADDAIASVQPELSHDRNNVFVKKNINPDYLNICICRPDKYKPSETFIGNHMTMLPANVIGLYGWGVPLYTEDDNRIATADLPEEEAYLQFFRQNNIQAVLAEYGPTGTFLVDICERSGVPLIVHFHGFDASSVDVLHEYSERYKDMFLKAAAIVVVSKPMENTLLEMGCPAEKLYCNPCGVDINTFCPTDSETREFDFLTVGRFVEKKAPYLTILAFNELLKRGYKSSMKMVGDGPLLGSCVQLARSLGCEKQIKFLGACSHSEIRRLMKEAKVFLQHSVTAYNGDSEGMPVGILEAGASGLPIVSTFHAGIPDAVLHEKTGFLVSEGDFYAMANYMEQLLTNDSLRRNMSICGREHVVQHFAIEKRIRSLWTIIEGAISKKQVECVCCKHRGEGFLPFGLISRTNAQCPDCGSLERDRLLMLFLKEQTNFFTENINVLHVAPEDVLQKRFSTMENLDYISVDLFSPKAMMKMDIKNILFKDNTFDVVICNHVLEHIEDDYIAMGELHRVLKPSGWAILNVPLDYERKKTYEDSTVILPSEREKKFGQEDHVRIYGRDYGQRLEKAGFFVEEIDYSSRFSQSLALKYGLKNTGKIYMCYKQQRKSR